MTARTRLENENLTQWWDSCPSCAKRSCSSWEARFSVFQDPLLPVFSSAFPAPFLAAFHVELHKDWIFPNTQSSSRLPGPPLGICLLGKCSPSTSLGWVRSYPLQRFNKMGQLNFAHTPTLPKNWCPLVSGMFFPQPDATTVSNMSPSIPETCLLSTEPNRNSNCRSFVELCGDGGTGTTLWMCKPPLNCSLHNG